MNVKPGGKYKGTRTLKRGSIYRIRNKSCARTIKGGGWGSKKKTPDEQKEDNQDKKEKADAQKIAKAEQKRIKDDAEATKKEKKKKDEAGKKAEKDRLKAEKDKLKEEKDKLKAEKDKLKAEKANKKNKPKGEEPKSEEAKPEQPKDAEGNPKVEEANQEPLKEEEGKPKEEEGKPKEEETKPKEEEAKQDLPKEKNPEEIKTEAKQEGHEKKLQLNENLTQETSTDDVVLKLADIDNTGESHTEEETSTEGAEQAAEAAQPPAEGAEENPPAEEGTEEQPDEDAKQPAEGTEEQEKDTEEQPDEEESEKLIEDNEDTTKEKPWWMKAKNGVSSAMKGTLKKTKSGLSAIGTAVKSPVSLYKYTKFKTKETLKGIKKFAANTAETLSPIRQAQRFKNWRKRTAKAKSDAKLNKYIDKQYEREQKIAKLKTDRANIMANNMNPDEKKAKLAELDKQIKSETKELKWDEEKVAEWAGKQNKASTALNNYTQYLGKKTGPIKEELNKKLDSEKATMLRSPVAQDIAQKEIEAELNAEFTAQENAAQTALAQDNEYQAAQTLANSDECKGTDETQPEYQKIKCADAKKTMSEKTANIDKIKKERALAKQAKEAEIQKRILKKNSMDLIGNSLQKLTKTMRLPSAISMPGTPEHSELQEKIQAHIDTHGDMPTAAKISEMVAGTAYEQTLSNTAKDMAKEIRDATTAGKAAYKTGDTALANILHPQAKTSVINQSIKDFIPKLESKITELQKPLTKKTGESDADFAARQASQASQLRMTQTVLQTVKQMTVAGKPPEEIYKFISRYNSEFGTTVAQKANNLEKRREKLKIDSPENTQAVERYYKAEMAKYGYNTNSSADPTPTPALIAFAKNYYNGTTPIDKTTGMTTEQIKTALANYKEKYLPSRIANNPDILNKLQKTPVVLQNPGMPQQPTKVAAKNNSKEQPETITISISNESLMKMGRIRDSEWQINSQGQLETTFEITNDTLLLKLMYDNNIYKYYEDTVNNLIKNALKANNMIIYLPPYFISKIIDSKLLKYNKPANQKFGTYEIDQTRINEIVNQKLNQYKNKGYKHNLINETTHTVNSSEA